MVTIQKMNKETPRAMVRAAGELVDARGRLMDEMGKAKGVASALASALAEFGKCRARVDEAIADMRSEEDRFKTETDAARQAMMERKGLEERWEGYVRCRKEGSRWMSHSIPRDPASVDVPVPVPVSEAVQSEFDEAMVAAVALASNLKAAAVAFMDHEESVAHLKAEFEKAVGCFVGSAERYDSEKKREELTRKQAMAEEEEMRQAEIAEARAKKAEAEATLAEYGVL